MMKQFQSYQSVWEDTYNDICDIVLDAAGITERQIDWEFPSITPADEAGIAQNIAALIPVLPELGYSDDVLTAALMAIGVKDINAAIEQLTDLANEEQKTGIAKEQSVNLKLAKALKEVQRILPKE
jgi:hypothetical protein